MYITVSFQASASLPSSYICHVENDNQDPTESEERRKKESAR